MNRLQRSSRIGYGAAEFGSNSVDFYLKLYFLVFLTQRLGLPPEVAGGVTASGVIWDAVIDPWIGSRSDRTRSRWGTRKPWVLAGSIGLASGLMLLFSAPAWLGSLSPWVRAGVASLLFIAVSSFQSFVAIPHSAWAAELTDDPAERNELYGWKFGFGNLGALLSSQVPALAEKAGFPGADGMILAATILLGSAWTLVFTRDGSGAGKKAAPAVNAIPFRVSLRQAGGNPRFLLLLVAYATCSIGLSVNSALSVYYYRYRLGLSLADEQAVIGLFLLIFTVSIPGWILAAKRFDPAKLLAGGVFGLGALVSIVYPLLPPGQAGGALWMSLVCGCLVGSVSLLEPLLVRTVGSEASFGTYFGIWKTMSKFCRALSLAGTGLALSWIGLSSTASQGGAPGKSLALIFGPGVGLFLMTGSLMIHVPGIIRRRESKK